MYRTINDFLEDWKNEASSTVKIFESITENVKSKKEAENLRTLERMAWHITQTLTEMPARANIIDTDVLEDEPIPAIFKEIINIYQKYSQVIMDKVASLWTDEMLLEKIEVYGQMWERRKILSVLVLHQAHHRGQMTALMRILGLKVPGIYGPAKEEWHKFGMEAMD